jgi:hypothetical protein
MRLRYRPLLLIPLVCAGGPAAVACGDPYGPNCAGVGKSCSQALPNCCGDLVCTDTPSGGSLCQRGAAQSVGRPAAVNAAGQVHAAGVAKASSR